jgi:UDP-N-acetylmuramate dehydrogenase
MAERLADLTTLRVGGRAERVTHLHTDDEIYDVVREADELGERLLILGGGSNVVCGDADFDGTVAHIVTRGIMRINEPDGVFVSVAAGESWDDLVAWSVSEGLSGIEAMSGIPGSVGATPIQNVGAYGQDLSAVCHAVVTWDRVKAAITHVDAQDLHFGYRTSRLKREPDQCVITHVTLRLSSSLTSPVQYPQLAEALNVEVGEQAPTTDIRDAVLGLRRAKGMVLDDADHDTWSVGSFFTNPIVDDDSHIDDACPRYPATHGTKLSAAWLIESAGITPGWGLNDAARISTKHVLAITNTGHATAADVCELAAAIRQRVQEAHGITLEIEPRLMGCEV